MSVLGKTQLSQRELTVALASPAYECIGSSGGELSLGLATTWQTLISANGSGGRDDRIAPQPEQGLVHRVDAFSEPVGASHLLGWKEDVGRDFKSTLAGFPFARTLTKFSIVSPDGDRPRDEQRPRRSRRVESPSDKLMGQTAKGIQAPLAIAGQNISRVANRLRRKQPLSGLDLENLDVARLQLLEANNWAEGILLQRGSHHEGPTAIRDRFYPPQLQSLVRPLLDSLATTRQVRLNWEGWDRSLSRLYTDANHMLRLLLILGKNAIESSRAGQSVGIQVHSQNRPQTRLIIDIHDEGTGLGPDLLRFVNRQASGDLSGSSLGSVDPALTSPGNSSVGLGLALSKMLAAGLGGSLSAKPLLNGRSSVRIGLPVDDPLSLVTTWLWQLPDTVRSDERQHLQRVQVHAIRTRGVNLRQVDREIQQAARATDFIYRVADDRWLWLTLANDSTRENSRPMAFAKQMNRMDHGEQAVCLAQKVFHSRVFALDSLHATADGRHPLPYLQKSIKDKVRALLGKHLPKIDDLQSDEDLIFNRPLRRQRGYRIVRTDGAARHDSHLTEPKVAGAKSELGKVQLLTALKEIAHDWRGTQARLDRSTTRVDEQRVRGHRPNSSQTVKVGAGLSRTRGSQHAKPTFSE